MRIRGCRVGAIILACCFRASGQQGSQANRLPEAPQPRQAARPNPDGGVYHAGDGVTPPTLVYQVAPEVSDDAHRIKGRRTCTVHLVVGADGRASDIHVHASSDTVRKQFAPRPCETEAIESVKEYRFRPATVQGRPVPFETTVDLDYEIE